jgi:hypothetical protein
MLLNVSEILCEVADWIYLTGERYIRRPLVNAVMNYQGFWKAEKKIKTNRKRC